MGGEPGHTHRTHTKPTPNAWEQGGPMQRDFKQESSTHLSMHALCMHASLPAAVARRSSAARAYPGGPAQRVG